MFSIFRIVSGVMIFSFWGINPKVSADRSLDGWALAYCKQTLRIKKMYSFFKTLEFGHDNNVEWNEIIFFRMKIYRRLGMPP